MVDTLYSIYESSDIMTNNQQFEVWRKAQEAELTQKLEALLPSILSRHVFYPEC